MRIKTIKKIFKRYLITLILTFALFTIVPIEFKLIIGDDIDFRVILFDMGTVLIVSIVSLIIYKKSLKALNDAAVDDAYEIATQLKRHRYCDSKQLDDILRTVEDIRNKGNK